VARKEEKRIFEQDMRILEVEGLKKNFGGLAAASDVEFHAEQGEIVGMIGPNGAGKTTLFNLVSGALTPDSGVIRFKGKNITGLKPYQITRMGIARTFQAVKVFPKMSVFDHVLLGYLFGNAKGTTSDRTLKEVTEILDFLELSEMRELPSKDLTVANQKRLEVARAVATKPELLLLDELMAGLNHTEVIQAMALVRKIREKGMTILMVEHVMKAIMDTCDRIIVLHHGEKIAEGRPEEIAKNKAVVEVYLGE
jgi:branched-chain amino acid transport system ATP-binding protein